LRELLAEKLVKLSQKSSHGSSSSQQIDSSSKKVLSAEEKKEKAVVDAKALDALVNHLGELQLEDHNSSLQTLMRELRLADLEEEDS